MVKSCRTRCPINISLPLTKVICLPKTKSSCHRPKAGAEVGERPSHRCQKVDSKRPYADGNSLEPFSKALAFSQQIVFPVVPTGAAHVAKDERIEPQDGWFLDKDVGCLSRVHFLTSQGFSDFNCISADSVQ